MVNTIFNDWFKNEYGKTSHISSRELREYLEKNMENVLKVDGKIFTSKK